MISKITEATSYICEAIKNLKHVDVLPEVVESILEEKLFDKIEPLLTEADLQMLSKNEDNEKFAEEYMVLKVPNYINLLEETVKEILTQYVTETQ